MESLLDMLSDVDVWEKFYDYKTALACPKQFTSFLRAFTDGRRYLPVCRVIYGKEAFPLPKRSVICKMGTDKKRVVYTYPEDENTVLKLLTYLLLRRYDGNFSRGLYSFRPGRTAKDAVRELIKKRRVFDMYAYKADIHDYFNSVPVKMLLPVLKETLSEDEKTYGFLASLLEEDRVVERGKTITEKKGIMAGTPLSSFYANLFLSDLDRYFADRGVIYARYSDDIILFAPGRKELETYARHVRSFLASRSLVINPDKENVYEPGEGFTFLGFSCGADKVDIASATVRKLKQKMRRKRDALARWKKRNGTDGESAAKAFIRVFNRKLLESPRDNELCWSSWFFPVINTAESLREIDLYAQDCIRYLVYGKHTKARFSVRYDDMKRLGYRSLVHEYYAHEAETQIKKDCPLRGVLKDSL